MKDTWDANLYDQNHSFVNEMVADLVGLLNPKSGEHILDLGCGTGPLTKKISESGATVLGIDASAAMIARARLNHPSLSFDVVDASAMNFKNEFDAIFSNAVLHWIKPPGRAIENMYRALKPGGRLVLEMGGKGNVATITKSAIDVGQSLGVDLKSVVDINYFPSIGQYTSLLEQAGFSVGFAVLFDRPTPLNDGKAGLINWIKMFRPGVIDLIPADQLKQFTSGLNEACEANLFQNGIWLADYRRLRVMASK